MEEVNNWMNLVSLVMNCTNSVNLMGQIVCSCQLYSENKKETHSIKDFVYKIESIIIHILEIYFVNFSSYYIKVNLGVLYSCASD